MKKIAYIIISSIFICFFSCKKDEINNVNTKENLSLKTASNKLISKDTLNILLGKALKVDTLEFDNFEPFIYFKSGNILSKNEKNALVVNCPNDSTYQIELYTQKNEKWIKNDEIKNILANRMQFYLDFKDYDFDGRKDIYLQKSASNGWSLSKGYLFTVNSMTKKLIEHKEVRELANMNPEKIKEIVYTDELDYSQSRRKINRRINKWKNGKLISLGIDKSKVTEY
jgi:hypothetical protein